MPKPIGFQGIIGLILIGVLILSAQPALSATSGIHINEVLFNPGDGAYQWVELKNSGTTAVNIAGYRITNEAGAWYTIPSALPAVPSGAFVVVVFDGAGSGGDDYNFSDKVTTLHSGPELVNVLGRTAGQCALYDSSAFKLYLPGILSNYQGTKLTILSSPTDFFLPAIPSLDAWGEALKEQAATVSKAGLWSKRWFKTPARVLGAGLSSAGPAVLSFVAWGGAPEDRAANASHAGLWSPRWFKSLVRGLGAGNPSTSPNETVGLLPGSLTAYPDDWTLYQAGEATKGKENSVPGVSFYYPISGATMEDASFTISWNPVRKATGYEFQLANDSEFKSLKENKTLPYAVYIPAAKMAQGTYYWRVRVVLAGLKGPWSTGAQIKSFTLPTLLAGADGPLGAPSQKKYVLPRIAWQLQHKDTTMLCLGGCPLTGNEAWNSPHTIRGTHGNSYCARASIAMMASYYGGDVSQDRLSYQVFKEVTPEDELGHDLGLLDEKLSAALTWALGVDVPTQFGKPTFSQVRNWVDANQPVITKFLNPDHKSAHARVMDGYFEVGSHQYIHLLDPWTQDTGAGKDIGWVKFTDDIDHVIAYWVGPAGPQGAPKVNMDEEELWKDSDKDGINDFDEIKRFKTDPLKGDSDSDQLMDKFEIQEYIFDPQTNAYSLRDADMDWDGKRKELDPDNDGGGLIDGCEDILHVDGFDPADDSQKLLITTVSPTGTVYTSTPTYKWNAVCGAKSYWLQVDDTTGRGKIYKGYSASEAGCPLGTGACSLTPAISLADGNATWWITACHLEACGPWSNARGFIVNTKNLPQSWVAGYTKPTGPFMATSFVMEKKDFVPAANKVVLGEGLGKSQAIENACREFDFLSEWHMCCCYYYGQHGSYKVCIDNSDWNRCKIIQP